MHCRSHLNWQRSMVSSSSHSIRAGRMYLETLLPRSMASCP